LIFCRKDPILLPILEADIKMIVTEFLIPSALLGVYEIDMREKNLKKYIDQEFNRTIDSFKSRRLAVCEFTQKLCEFKMQGKKPEYLDFVYEFLLNTITTNNLNLHKESCFNILESISYLILKHHQDDVEFLISSFLMIDSSPLFLPLLDRSLSFFLKIFSKNFKIKSPSLLKKLLEHILTNLSAFEYDLSIKLKYALIFQRISNGNAREYHKKNIDKIFQIFIQLIKELDLDELLISLQNLISLYPTEVFEFSLDFTKELVLSFDRIIRDENKINCQTSGQSDESNESDEEESSVLSRYRIIETLNKLLQICSKNKIELFYQIQSQISPIIFWSLTSDINCIFIEVLKIIFTITSCKFPLTENIWLIYPAILNSLFPLNTNTGCFTEGLDLKHFNELLPIILNFILKEPQTLLLICDSEGTLILNKTMEYIPRLINHFNKNKEEYSCAMVTKILISLLETYKEKLDDLLKGIVLFLIEQMNATSSGIYTRMLSHTLSLCYVYNPQMTNAIVEEINFAPQNLEMWVEMINNMRFDFEFRRTSLAYSSVLLIEESKLNLILRNNLGFVLTKIIELLRKCVEIKERKYV
jgi:hypothetical protein